jgi:hypothetical protein
MDRKQLLFSVSKLTGKYIWISLIVVALAGFSSGQTIAGTLTDSSSTTTTSGTCSIETTTNNWTFTDTLNVAHGFPNPTVRQLLLGCSGTCAGRLRSDCTTKCGCPPSGSSTQNEWSSDGRYFLKATGTSGSVTAEAGYVDPKFLVLGVTYAPPGPSANTSVSYTNSTFVGSTQSLSQSFMGSTTESVTLTRGFSIPMVASGKFSNTVATTATQSNKTTSTVTSSVQVSSGEKTFGTGDYFAPVNHDYDQIWVWLNPVAIFTINAGTPLPVWNGYGADSTDQNGLDIVPIPLGYLNGHFGAIPPDIQTSINRTWAANQMWPAGQGPALNSADLAQVASSDPFSVSTYGPNEIGSAPPSPSTPDNRFTLTTCNSSNSFSYLQAAPSTTANIFTCTLTYTNLSTLAQEISASYSQTFSVDDSFSGLGFFSDFSAELKTSNTLTWTTDAQSSLTTSTSSTGSLSVQGPPCNNVMLGVGPCVPVYDVNGNQPTQFMVYQDNMFGTFMFAPVHFY